MDFDWLSGDLKDMRRRNRGLGLAVGALAAGMLLALAIIINLLATVRTVVVPPSISKSFWVTSERASSEYLEQGYVDPAQYGLLKTRQEVEAERLKRINAATAFAPQQLVASEETQSLVVRGRLRTLVNGYETANDLKAYRIEFGHAGARMHVIGFKEVPYAVK